MGFESWRAFYQSDLQGVYALLVLPAVFLGWWLASGRWRVRPTAPPGAGFLHAYLLWFCVETLVDPLATGPGTRALGLSDAGATAVALLFVLLGDLRVYLLVFVLADAGRRPGRAVGEALLWTPAVAVAGSAANAALGAALGPLPGQVLWLCHETIFVGVALYLRRVVVPARVPPEDASRRALLRTASGYVAVYYALWASADVLILAGLDAGWALRVVPNQLYYAAWIPFVYGAARGSRFCDFIASK